MLHRGISLKILKTFLKCLNTDVMQNSWRKIIMSNIYNEIRKELFMKMKFMDTTIKRVTESTEYKEVSIYNDAIRDAIKILDTYKEEISK